MKKNQEFQELIDETLNHPLVQNMSNLEQHADIATLLEHLVYTAYISYRLASFFKLNKRETARGALLHDFRLDDDRINRRWTTHSITSMVAASKHFDLTDLEKDIILGHMWPLTPTILPKSREAWVVNIADTYCAIMEFLTLFKKTRTTKWVVRLSNV